MSISSDQSVDPHVERVDVDASDTSEIELLAGGNLVLYPALAIPPDESDLLTTVRDQHDRVE